MSSQLAYILHIYSILRRQVYLRSDKMDAREELRYEPNSRSYYWIREYVNLSPDVKVAEVADTLKADNYFCDSETHVYAVEKIENYRDMGHKVLIEHKGRSGSTHNQCIHYSHYINNPAATGQVMVCAARAVIRQKPGCFTMLEIPLADYLDMSLQEAINHIV